MRSEVVMSSAEVRSTGSRFLENLAYLVPSYHGYRDRGSRREEDSRLRARVLQGLSEIRGLMADLLGNLAETWSLIFLEAVDRRMKRLDTLADAIRYAPYGFSGFFDGPDVREEVLERVLECDLLIFDDLDHLECQMQRARGLQSPAAGFEENIREIDCAISRLEHHLIQRDKTLGDV